MLKKHFLLLGGLALAPWVLPAQVDRNNKPEKAFVTRLRLDQELNYAKAINLSKEKNWRLVINTPNGKLHLVGVDGLGFPVYEQNYSNATAAATTRANQLWPGGSSGLGLNGSSPAMRDKLGIWEAESQVPLPGHVELTGRINQKDNTGSPGVHATHVAGTMIATGVNPSAKGMAFAIPSLISYDTRSNQSELAAETGLLLSNHSYGIPGGWSFNSTDNRWEFFGRPNENEDFDFGYYSNVSLIVDSIAINNPNHLMVFSAGNPRNVNGPAVGTNYWRPNAQGVMISAGPRPAGISSNDSYDVITHYGIAKNVLTVGAVGGIATGYSRPSDVVMSSFSAWGPTDDGRIKPDVVAMGVSVLSTSSSAANGYATLSGTSMSAPNATGSLLLLQEHYQKLVPSNFMRSATLKAIAIHTTEEAGGTPGPDYAFGWGLLNVLKGSQVMTQALGNPAPTNREAIVLENNLAQGGSFTRTVVASGKGPLVATICWIDPPASVTPEASYVLNDRTKKLVNDLDIRITRAGSTAVLPWTLNPDNPSLAAQRGDNSIDNVEKVEVDSTLPGETYTITVTHKGTLQRGSQPYSLVISGIGGTAYCASASGGAGARIDSLRFAGINFANTAGCKTYTNNTNLTGDIQNLQSLPFSFRVSTCDGGTAARFLKAFIDFNADGDFDDAGENVYTSASIAAAATTVNGTISIPAGLPIGNFYRMRVVVQEAANAAAVLPCGNYARGETQDYRLRVVLPTTDLAMSNILSPNATSCGNNQQYVTIAIKNNSVTDQTNVPLTLTVTNGSTTVLNITENFRPTIIAGGVAEHTFQTPFNALAGTTYNIQARVNMAGDQDTTNNRLAVDVPMVATPASPNGEAAVCNTNAILRVLSPSTLNYYWYDSPTSNTPIGVGSNTTTSNVPTNRTFYLGTDARTSVGAVSKLTFPNGGYNQGLGGNFMSFTHSIPFTIETVRMYTANPGKLRITLGQNMTPSTTTPGSYSYNRISEKTFDVTNSRPVASTTPVSENDPADSGFVYRLDFAVPGSGDKILILETLDQNGVAPTSSNGVIASSIYRNNGITGTTYPNGISGIMTYTNNSVSLQTGTNSNAFWYFFYDTRISTGCPSDRRTIVAAANTPVTVSQVADSLVASTRVGTFTWTYNDTAFVSGANGSSIKPTRSGNYKVTVIDAFGCSRTSANVNYTATAIMGSDPQEIKLAVSPNPNNGRFQLRFETSTRSDLSIEAVNALGQRVYQESQSGFIGKYSKVLNLENQAAEFLLLKIQHNKKTYLQKIILQR